MARIDWIEQRLQNWVRWAAMKGSGALGYAGVNLAGCNAGRDGYIEAAIPTSDIEASETDSAVQRLPSELRATVVEIYLGSGGLAEKLTNLCCAKATAMARIDRAHRMLADHFLAKQDRQRAERERVEALLEMNRPCT